MQAMLVLSGIVVARALGPMDRGYLALLALVPAVLWQLGSLGLPVATTYFIAQDPSSRNVVARRIRRPALLQCAVLLPAHAVILLALVSSDPTRVLIAAAITLIVVPISLVQQYGLAMLQGQQLFGPFNVLRVLPLAIYSLAAITVVAAKLDTLITLTACWTASFCVAAGVTLVAARRSLERPPPVPHPEAPATQGEFDSLVTSRGTSPRTEGSLRAMIRFGLRGLLGSSSPIETFRLDQVLVGLLLAPAALGIYVVALAFTNLPRFVAQSIGMVAFPQVAATARSANRQLIIWRFFGLTMALAGAVVIVLEFAAPALVQLFFGDEFASAVPVTRVLLVGALFFAGRRVLTDGVRGLGHPGAGSAAEFISWLALIPLLAVLAPLSVRDIAIALAWSSGLSLAFLVGFVLLTPAGEPGSLRGHAAARAR
jgi:O-antigen/teichoic acid export membrane protein